MGRLLTCSDTWALLAFTTLLPFLSAGQAWGQGPDTTPPVVQITSPPSGSLVYTSSVRAEGTASDSGRGVDRVEVRLNGGPWTLAAGIDSWSAEIALPTGTNLIEARAIDRAGNVSAIVSSVVTRALLPLRLTIATDRSSYLPGEPVRITLHLANVGSEAFTLSFNDSCQAYFIVSGPGVVSLYDERRHQICFAVVTWLTLRPGEFTDYHFVWNQTDDAGNRVPAPATYGIQGFIEGYESLLVAGAAVSIVTSECADGLDNDGDGLVDYPADPGCLGPADESEFDYFGVIDVTIKTDREVYGPGDPVAVELFVTNLSTEPVTLNFPTDCETSFRVEDEQGVVIFEPILVCLTVLTRRTLQPSETVPYGFVWPQVRSDGQPVPVPSQWNIRGIVFSIEPVPHPVTPVRIARECMDGVDNDFDGKIDYPEDPECASPGDDFEEQLVAIQAMPTGLKWTENPNAAGYDVVTGDLDDLRGSRGDFTTARACLANDTPFTTLEYLSIPNPGRGIWFLVRSVYSWGNGTYDSDSPAQVGGRDFELNVAGNGCP